MPRRKNSQVGANTNDAEPEIETADEEIEIIDEAVVGPKPLEFWSYSGTPMTMTIPPASLAVSTESYQRTAHYLNALRQVRTNHVRTILEGNPVIQRMLTLKTIRDKGNVVPNNIVTVRPQQASAVEAGHQGERICVA
ncbi:hypothetical protein F4861DRAFT_540067 [Xylaria intraflava]|nr:hypothetical protein F4861DRAFT_540067 [Xylaria intraflava]